MPLGFQLAIAFVGGGLLGLLIGWLLGRGRGTPDGRLEVELRQQVASREMEVTQLRSQLTEAGNARAAANRGERTQNQVGDDRRQEEGKQDSGS